MMRKVLVGMLLVCLVFLSGTGICAAQPVEEWSKTFGGSLYDGTESVQQTSDGGYIIAGYNSRYGNVGGDAWLIKLGLGRIATPAPTVTHTSVTATPSPSTISTPIPKPQGFGGVFAIAGLLAVTYISRRS